MHQKNTKKTPRTRKSITTLIVVAGLLVVCSVFVSNNKGVRADQISSQIDSLSQQNAQSQSVVSGLQLQAASYQDEIDRLQVQISGLQTQIDANTQQQQSIQTQIAANQAKLDQQRSILGDDIKSMYVDGQITTIEMLATSKNLDQFVDKEEFRTVVQNKIQDTLNTITKLQNQLNDQKQQVEQLLNLQKGQQAQLDSAQGQQQSLLSMNESQQASYDDQIKANDAQIAKLEAEQVAQNRTLFGSVHYGGTGSYPYSDAVCMNPGGDCGASSFSPYNWGEGGQPYDPAGWQYRNCTSYAFWRLDQVTGIGLTAGSFPTVLNSGGKIGYSIPDFRNLGFTVDHNPANSILAVEGSGPYGPGAFGHIMYIESSTSSSAFVSQYNEAGDGLYSTMTITPSSGIWFVHR